MAPYLFPFRQLYHQLLESESWQVAPLLQSWAAQNAPILEPYRKFQRFNAPDNLYAVERAELESLYALSRVCDVLLLPFQPGESWFGLNAFQFADFWHALGMTSREPDEYHPFWCEIVACENGADDAATPRIEEWLWPALTWGELLICRAGVRLSAGRAWLNGDVAASSPLYFASRRNYRTAHDLSHGWGHNSQWGTEFRRDYVWNDHYVFNADGAPGLDKAPFLQNLSATGWANLKPQQFFASDFHRWEPGELGSIEAERESLLVNRCLINQNWPDAEFWPYDDVAIWRQNAPLAPLN